MHVKNRSLYTKGIDKSAIQTNRQNREIVTINECSGIRIISCDTYARIKNKIRSNRLIFKLFALKV